MQHDLDYVHAPRAMRRSLIALALLAATVFVLGGATKWG